MYLLSLLIVFHTVETFTVGCPLDDSIETDTVPTLDATATIQLPVAVSVLIVGLFGLGAFCLYRNEQQQPPSTLSTKGNTTSITAAVTVVVFMTVYGLVVWWVGSQGNHPSTSIAEEVVSVPVMDSTSITFMVVHVSILIVLLFVLGAYWVGSQQETHRKASQEQENDDDYDHYIDSPWLFTPRPSRISLVPILSSQRESLPFQNEPQHHSQRIPYEEITFHRLLSRNSSDYQVFQGFYQGQMVAIKRLVPAKRNDPHSLARFLQDITLMERLHHERVVRFLGVAGYVWWDPCVVTALMEHGDLYSVLGRLPPIYIV